MIVFENVAKSFVIDVRGKRHIALRGLSFQVEAGQCLGLIGANGAGKSTSIRLLMDFIRPDSGRIELFGQPGRKPRLRSRIGYLPDVAMFPPSLTVLDLLCFTAQACGIASSALAQRSQELLTMLDLWEVRRRPLRKFSKGMQQRASFAVALVNDPELLILDEPMSGLDPIGREKISALIARLKQEGKTILFCSHILYDVDRLVDNILLLDHGRKLFFGRPAELVREERAQNLGEAFVGRINRVRQEAAHV